MLTVTIRDNNIFSSNKTQHQGKDVFWQWYQGTESAVSVFTDRRMPEVITSKSKVKIAWILEPPTIDGFPYGYIVENYKAFDKVLTFSKELLALDPRFMFWSSGTTWIKPENRGVCPKTKQLSIIASGKNYAPGHSIRHAAISAYRAFMDVMGRGYVPIEFKEEGLLPYRYQLVAENSQYPDYFTEKLIDCFMTGTVPIYWGCPAIGDYFDLGGIIPFSTMTELAEIMKSLSEEDYQRRLPAITRNYQKAQEHSDLFELAGDLIVKGMV